jgi:hypothetical protein
MRLAFTTILMGVTFAVGVAASAEAAIVPATVVREISLELIGQGLNTPLGVVPGSSTQFGYVAYLRGLPIFATEEQDERSALVTFYVQATTRRVISDGPLRVISRRASVTFYRDTAADGDFAKPDTFRDGTPILVAGLRQQVVLDTITNAFTAYSVNTIARTSPFAVGKQRLQLGRIGQRFRTYLTGHANMPGPPSAYFSGYTSS